MRNTDTTATEHSLYRRQIPSGEARCAVFRRTYDAPIEDVWQACTDPERLRRWYAPVEGDLQVGGSFTQGDFGSGLVLRCEAPTLLTVALGGGDPAPDQIELRLAAGPGETTLLEFEHATTIDTHTIGGEIYDAVYCMGGGYDPRLDTLDLYLRGELPDDLDATLLHLRPEFRGSIEAGMAALDELVQADKRAHGGA